VFSGAYASICGMASRGVCGLKCIGIGSARKMGRPGDVKVALDPDGSARTSSASSVEVAPASHLAHGTPRGPLAATAHVRSPQGSGEQFSRGSVGVQPASCS
jgi:hypothetical protein